jgi:hypothetical protein
MRRPVMLDRHSSASLGPATVGRVGDAQFARPGLGSKRSSAMSRRAVLGRTSLGSIQLPKPGGLR